VNTQKKGAIMFTEFTKKYNENAFKLWERYIKGNEPMPDSCDEIRPVIYESWKRCIARKISPLNVKDEKLDMVKLDKTLTRSKYLVDVAHSYILNLYGFVKGSNYLIALTDEHGYVIDLIGQDAQIQAKARQSGLSIGSNRSEKYAGTNGIGTCLYTKQPIQIWGCEHYIEPHHKYV
jgi:transcriptional regulator of acetoin/glycerol metabolism